MLIVFLYVDDLIFTGDYGIVDFKAVMESEFEMTDLGIEVQQSESGIFISQSKYASEILKRFNMSNCKTTPTPVNRFKIEHDGEGSTVDPMLFKMHVASLFI